MYLHKILNTKVKQIPSSFSFIICRDQGKPHTHAITWVFWLHLKLTNVLLTHVLHFLTYYLVLTLHTSTNFVFFQDSTSILCTPHTSLNLTTTSSSTKTRAILLILIWLLQKYKTLLFYLLCNHRSHKHTYTFHKLFISKCFPLFCCLRTNMEQHT